MAEAEEEVTLEELIALANEGDEEALAALYEVSAEYDIDPDSIATWEEVGELLEAAMAESEEEPEAEEEEEEEASEPVDGWTADALKSLTLKEVREHAAAAGIENAKTAPRVELVKALVGGTGSTPAAKPSKKGTSAPSGDGLDIDALADAIIDRLIARLS